MLTAVMLIHMGRRSLLDALWAMAVLTCVVLVAVTAGSLFLAFTADTSSAIGLDAWRGVVMTAPALIVASSILAVLTVLRLRRGSALDAAIVPDEAEPKVVRLGAEPMAPLVS